MNIKDIQDRLEQIRSSIRNENISYSEIGELQNLKDYIQNGDVELAQWAGIDETEFLNRPNKSVLLK